MFLVKIIKTYSLRPQLQLAQGLAPYIISLSPQNFFTVLSYVASPFLRRSSSLISSWAYVGWRLAHGFAGSEVYFCSSCCFFFLIILGGPWFIEAFWAVKIYSVCWIFRNPTIFSKDKRVSGGQSAIDTLREPDGFKTRYMLLSKVCGSAETTCPSITSRLSF